ncbi:MAG: hypothetical protein ACXVDP_10335 [Bacteroidia bacterium]
MNINYLSSILVPITGSADIDKEYLLYGNLDGNDEIQMKNEIIIPKLYQQFYESPQAYKEAVKLALSFYLTKRNIDFGLVFDSCLIAFEHPDNPIDFFIWIWEVFFY